MDQQNVLLINFCENLAPRHYLMLKTLKSLGWRVNVIVWDRSSHGNIGNRFGEIVDEWHSIRIQASTEKLSIITKMPKLFYELAKNLRHIKKPDLVILTHLVFLPLAPFISGKIVYDDIEMFFAQIPIFYLGPLANISAATLRLIVGLLISWVDGVSIVDSRQGWLEKFYQQWHPLVQVIWNVPSSLQEAMPSVEEAVASQLAERAVVAYVGGSFQQKGLHVALEACALIKQWHREVLFLFIGRMSDDAEAIRQLIESLEIYNNIWFLAQMPYKNMMAHLNYAKIGIALYQPGFHYDLVSAGNGRKIFTYMQAGLPIVAPNFGEIGLIVKREGCGLLVDTTKPEEISQAILHLLDHPAEAQKMGEKGRQAFLEKYNWEREEQKYVSFLERIQDDQKKSL
jgi:glycosyltransferase involved in cell wall biosynthesis